MTRKGFGSNYCGDTQAAKVGRLHSRQIRKAVQYHILPSDWAERELRLILLAEHEAESDVWVDDLLEDINRDGCLRVMEAAAMPASPLKEVTSRHVPDPMTDEHHIVSDEKAAIWMLYQEHCELVRRLGL